MVITYDRSKLGIYDIPYFIQGMHYKEFMENLDKKSLVQIGNSLASITRWAGDSNNSLQISVLTHSIALSELVLMITNDPRLAAWALMHDAHEAFMGDTITPAKDLIPPDSDFFKVANDIDNILAKDLCGINSMSTLEPVHDLDKTIRILEAVMLEIDFPTGGEKSPMEKRLGVSKSQLRKLKKIYRRQSNGKDFLNRYIELVTLQGKDEQNLPVRISAYEKLQDMIVESEGTDDISAVKRGYESGYDVPLGYGAYLGTVIPLTQMTIREVLNYQIRLLNAPANKLNSSACGRYQIVSQTIRSLMGDRNIKETSRFNEEMQDLMYHKLLLRRGLEKLQRLEITPEEFLLGLSKEWASIPSTSHVGYSNRGYYSRVHDRKTKYSIDEFLLVICDLF